MAEEQLQRIITSLFNERSSHGATGANSTLIIYNSVKEVQSTTISDSEALLEEEKEVLISSDTCSRSDSLVV